MRLVLEEDPSRRGSEGGIVTYRGDVTQGEGPRSQSREKRGEPGPCGLQIDKKEPTEETEGARTGRRETGRVASWQPGGEGVSGRRRGERVLSQAEMRRTVPWA